METRLITSEDIKQFMDTIAPDRATGFSLTPDGRALFTLALTKQIADMPPVPVNRVQWIVEHEFLHMLFGGGRARRTFHVVKSGA